MGKTVWARSLGHHVYFNTVINYEHYDDDADYAVFDDLGGFKFFPSYKAWLGCQLKFDVNEKYKRKKRIHWGRPSIYLSNTDPRNDEAVDYDWLVGNCEIVYVGEPLVTIN